MSDQEVDDFVEGKETKNSQEETNLDDVTKLVKFIQELPCSEERILIEIPAA